MGLDLQKVETFRDEIRLNTLKELYHLGFGHYGGAYPSLKPWLFYMVK
jgi:transketolase